MRLPPPWQHPYIGWNLLIYIYFEMRLYRWRYADTKRTNFCKGGIGSIQELFDPIKRPLIYVYHKLQSFIWSQGSSPPQWLRSSFYSSLNNGLPPCTYITYACPMNISLCSKFSISFSFIIDSEWDWGP